MHAKHLENSDNGPASAQLFSRAVPTKEASLPAYLRWKSLLDRAAAVMLLIPGLPMICLLVILIRLTSRGPGVYHQERVGKNGKRFTMYKLRSMRTDAESKTGPVWSAAGSDSRVTRLGYWLRRLHLDELPQLFNVVKGEMSLVGPRPERPEFVKVLAVQIDGYLDRLHVLPGVTGLAQVNLPADTDLDSVRRKIVLDCQYIQTAGLLLDFRLILCTILRCVGLRGGRAVSLLGLTRRVVLPAETAPIGGLPDAPPATPANIVKAPDTPAATQESVPTDYATDEESPPPKRRRRSSDSQILSLS